MPAASFLLRALVGGPVVCSPPRSAAGKRRKIACARQAGVGQKAAQNSARRGGPQSGLRYDGHARWGKVRPLACPPISRPRRKERVGGTMPMASGVLPQLPTSVQRRIDRKSKCGMALGTSSYSSPPRAVLPDSKEMPTDQVGEPGQERGIFLFCYFFSKWALPPPVTRELDELSRIELERRAHRARRNSRSGTATVH